MVFFPSNPILCRHLEVKKKSLFITLMQLVTGAYKGMLLSGYHRIFSLLPPAISTPVLRTQCGVRCFPLELDTESNCYLTKRAYWSGKREKKQ